MTTVKIDLNKTVKQMKPIHGYYSMVAFNALYRLGTQVESQCNEDRLYVLAASSGKKHAAMIVNLTGQKQEPAIEGVDLNNARYSLIDQEHLLSWIPNANVIQNNDVILMEW